MKMMMSQHWKPLLLLLLQVVSLTQTNAASTEQEERILQDLIRTDLVRLIPFDVQIALDMAGRSSTTNFDHLNLVYLTDVVTEWMNDSFLVKAQAEGLLPNSTSFSSVGLVLENPAQRRSLRQLQTNQNTGVFSASFSGVSLWEREGLVPMDAKLVELIQRATFLEGNKLLVLLQGLDDATGFGTRTLNVRAFITPESSSQPPPASSDTDKNLEIIIIIAIVVACSAFGLLLFAVIWAWKTDQSKQNQQNFKSELSAPGGTGSGSNYSPKRLNPSSPQANGTAAKQNNKTPSPANRPPTEISPDNYPESIISEDISTALTAYYRSGMAGYSGGGSAGSSGGGGGIHQKSRELNDAASMSSMDSYGYSLDGYAPSLSGGPTQMGYPVGPLGPVNGQVKDPDDDEDEVLPPKDAKDEEYA